MNHINNLPVGLREALKDYATRKRVLELAEKELQEARDWVEQCVDTLDGRTVVNYLGVAYTLDPTDRFVPFSDDGGSSR
jgi:hypothetical protein